MRTIDETIEELRRTTGVRFASKKEYDKAVIRLDLMPDVLHYLEEYKNLAEKPRNQRLIDVLREVRGEK